MSMHIKMDETRRGSEDGFRVIQYSKGVVYYSVPDTLACHFIRNGWGHRATLAEMSEQINRAREDAA